MQPKKNKNKTTSPSQKHWKPKQVNKIQQHKQTIIVIKRRRQRNLLSSLKQPIATSPSHEGENNNLKKQKTKVMCSSSRVATGSIGFDVRLESEGSDTYHLLSWFHFPTMCSTNKTLNLLKILIREVEFYLPKKSMGIQSLKPTNHDSCQQQCKFVQIKLQWKFTNFPKMLICFNWVC
jgi:hypothetical protein